MKSVTDRIYADFFLPDRSEEYASILGEAAELGYTSVTLRDFAGLLRGPGLDPSRLYLLLMHDIDTDPSGAARFLDVETRLGMRASYFFRLSTLDYKAMETVEKNGGEASYHYEEFSNIIKKRGLKQTGQIEQYLPEMRDLFHANLTSLRKRTGLPLSTVAAHGDFINRLTGISNRIVSDNAELRASLGIMADASDPDITQATSSFHSDELYPRFWRNGPVVEQLRLKKPAICFLSHPRHWNSNPSWNFREDFRRFQEGLLYSAGVANPFIKTQVDAA